MTGYRWNASRCKAIDVAMTLLPSRYEVFPAHATLDGGRVRVFWSWRQILRSGTLRHAMLYDTLGDCLAAIKRRGRRHTQPVVRVVLDPGDSAARG
jgi:hypothetical protein